MTGQITEVLREANNIVIKMPEVGFDFAFPHSVFLLNLWPSTAETTQSNIAFTLMHAHSNSFTIIITYFSKHNKLQ